MITLHGLFKAGAALVALTIPLAANSISHIGTFSQDDNEVSFSFSLATQEIVTMQTWSYAGGTNAGSVLIAAGGFDPVLTVFDSAGNWQGANDDGTGMVATDKATGNAFDSYLSLDLAPGAYDLFLTEADNTAVDELLSDGFTQTGNGNFSCPEFIGIEGSFCDATPAFRNGSYAVDIVYADSAASNSTPEPATGITFLVAAVAIAFAHSRRKRSLN